MSIVVLKLPDVKQKREERPQGCQYGAGEMFQRRGQVKKPVKEVQVRNVKVYRYRCCHCQRTFRDYPAGNTSADQTERLRLFAILLWTLGLSQRASSLILSGLIFVSHMTIWRDVQAEAQQIHKRNQWKPVRLVGLDGAYVFLGWGEKQAVLVAVDLGTGEPLAIGYINEYDPHALRRWLEPLVQRHGITVIVTDDLSSYKIVAVPGAALGRQNAQRVQETIPKEWLWVLAEIHQLIDLLPPDGSKTLYALWKQLPGRRSLPSQARSAMEQLRDLLLRLNDHCQNYCTFQSEPEIPWTNNATERSIGKMKMRARTLRDYKSWTGMQAGLTLAGSSII